jgi:predicted metal-dependent peptidase
VKSSKEFKERYSRIRSTLLLDQPFYAYLLLGLELKEQPPEKVPTIATDGMKVIYNADWVQKQTDSELAYVLCHEVLHCALEHLKRRKKRRELIWNYAADIVVNKFLEEDKIGTEPKGAVSPETIDFSGSVEEVYDFLLRNVIEIPSSFGFDEHEYSNTTKETEAKPSQWPLILSQAKAYANKQGKLPKHIEKEIAISIEGFFPWQRLLAEYLDHTLQWDVTFATPNKRFISQNLYLPSPLKQAISILVGIDTSGSVTEKDVGYFLGETFSILQKIHNCTLTIVQCDAEIQKIDIVTIRDPIPPIVEIKGRGGTNFEPVFSLLEKEEYNVVLYFTDGYGKFPEKASLTPTIWIITSSINPPWGTKVKFYPEEYYRS